MAAQPSHFFPSVNDIKTNADLIAALLKFDLTNKEANKNNRNSNKTILEAIALLMPRISEFAKQSLKHQTALYNMILAWPDYLLKPNDGFFEFWKINHANIESINIELYNTSLWASRKNLLDHIINFRNHIQTQLDNLQKKQISDVASGAQAKTAAAAVSAPAPTQTPPSQPHKKDDAFMMVAMPSSPTPQNAAQSAGEALAQAQKTVLFKKEADDLQAKKNIIESVSRKIFQAVSKESGETTAAKVVADAIDVITKGKDKNKDFVEFLTRENMLDIFRKLDNDIELWFNALCEPANNNIGKEVKSKYTKMVTANWQANEICKALKDIKSIKEGDVYTFMATLIDNASKAKTIDGLYTDNPKIDKNRLGKEMNAMIVAVYDYCSQANQDAEFLAFVRSLKERVITRDLLTFSNPSQSSHSTISPLCKPILFA